MKLTAALKTWLNEHAGCTPGMADAELRLRAGAAVRDGTLPPAKLAELVSPPGTDVGALLAEGQRVRVRGAGERYSTTKTVAKHVKTGQPVLYRDKPAETASKLELAKFGAWMKWLARRGGVNVSLSEHERALVEETMMEDTWVGQVGQEIVTLPGGERVKALLDDAVSGGTSLNPHFVDDQLVIQLLLNSEIMPYVDLKEVPRGRIVDVASMGTPVVTWGVPEGTPIPLFDTTGLIAGINATLFPVVAAVEVGNDLLADDVHNVGDALMGALGERFKADMDKQLALGDGVTQPQGIFNAAGALTAASVNGATGPVTIADAEALIFAMGKQYRQAGIAPSFVGNDVTYRRFRTIKTATGWNTYAGGQDLGDYRVLGYPWRVQNDVPNTKAAFVGLAKYRLYRRAGFEGGWTSAGKTLRLANTSLLTMRGRFGGRVMDSNACVLMTNLQT
jgi:HK97 family phage major capsid protein